MARFSVALVVGLTVNFVVARVAESAPQYADPRQPDRTASKAPSPQAKPTVDLSASCKDLDTSVLDAKLAAEERAATNWLVGFELSPPPASVDWLEVVQPGASLFQGKVVLLANTASGGKSRTQFKKLQESLGELATDPNLMLVALHTPDGAKAARNSIEKQPWGCAVAIDAEGQWCDGLGLYKESVILAVDKRGDVRAVGLSVEGAVSAAKTLLAEPFDAATDKPTVRPVPKPADALTIQFPSHVGPEFRMVGRDAPEMSVERWIKDPVADASGRVVVLDFWEPWCGPCRASIPHMNDLQGAYANDVVCVGISGMSNRDFEKDCLKYKLKERDFAYGLALSPGQSMHQALGVKRYPTVFVVSGDWKVRWQGHPMSLNDAVLRPIVEANQKLMELTNPQGAKPSRKDTWASRRR